MMGINKNRLLEPFRRLEFAVADLNKAEEAAYFSGLGSIATGGVEMVAGVEPAGIIITSVGVLLMAGTYAKRRIARRKNAEGTVNDLYAYLEDSHEPYNDHSEDLESPPEET